MNWNLRIDHNPRVLRCRAVHRRFHLDAAAGADIVLGGSIPENRPDDHFYSPTVTKSPLRLGSVQDEVSGTVCMDRHRDLTSEFPHSGFELSGSGRETSEESVLDHTVPKHMLLKHSRD